MIENGEGFSPETPEEKNFNEAQIALVALKEGTHPQSGGEPLTWRDARRLMEELDKHIKNGEDGLLSRLGSSAEEVREIQSRYGKEPPGGLGNLESEYRELTFTKT